MVTSSPEYLRICVTRRLTRSAIPLSLVPVGPSTRMRSPAWTIPSESRKIPASRSRSRSSATCSQQIIRDLLGEQEDPGEQVADDLLRAEAERHAQDRG